MNDRSHRSILAVRMTALLSVLAIAMAHAGEQVPVSDELERLSKEHGFTVTGLEQTEEAVGRADREELYPRLRRLLENFDHVIIQSATGGVDRIIVLGAKVPFEPAPAPAMARRGETPGGKKGAEEDAGGDIVVDTTRKGTQHAVQVAVEGKAGKRIELSLLVDTGADYLVLPRSLLSRLGLKADELRKQEMQTANGKVPARVGTISALWLGESRIDGVEAAFIDDKKLGENGLLGMSVLGRYRMTIDDERSRLTLTSKQSGTPANGEGTDAELEDADPEGEEADPEDPDDRSP